MAKKVIKEIITDVGGNTTIEYSDDTVQKYNVADVVTAQTNPLTGGIKTLVVLTQAQYDALATKDAETQYNIVAS